MPDPGETLFYVLGSEDFHNFYRQYIRPEKKGKGARDEDESESTGDLLENYLQKLRSPECRIAVLGIQGSGKTSMLNSLIFGEEVLPVAVEETTCIPTMLRKPGDDEKPGAEVRYEDGRVEQIPLKQKFLANIVDNKFNPGNLIEASYVLCRVESPLLKEGFIFVDLPGVGSLTKKNEETTMRFLQETNVGIFMLRTVPPITDSEARFIRNAWPMIQDSIFVQNLWMQETEEEIAEGMEHNAKVLKAIAEEQDASVPEHIIPVNVAEACKGLSLDDKQLVEESGLNDLITVIRKQIRSKFLYTLQHNTAGFFTRLINSARGRIKDQLQILQSDHEAVREKFEAEKHRYWEQKDGLENKVQEYCQEFQEKLQDLQTDWINELFNTAADKALEKLDEMPLEAMKEDDFRQAVGEVFRELFGLSFKQARAKLAQCASEYVDSLGETLQQIASLDTLKNELYGKKDKKDPKAAKGWSIALTGSIAPLVVSGPIGWSILGGSFLVGGIVRWISGATAHRRIMRGVRKAIYDGKNRMKEEMKREIENFSNAVIAAIQETVTAELDAYAAELEKIEQTLHQEEGKRQEQIAKLQEDLQNSKVFIDTLAQV